MDIPFTYKTLDDKAYYCLSIFYARSGWPALLAQVLAFHAQPLPPIGNGAAYHRWLAIAKERLAAGTRNTFGSLVADICRHLGLNDSHYLLILACLAKGAE